MAESAPTKTFLCDAPDCRSSVTIAVHPTTDEDQALNVRGWCCVEVDGEQKHYCLIHKDLGN